MSSALIAKRGRKHCNLLAREQRLVADLSRQRDAKRILVLARSGCFGQALESTEDLMRKVSRNRHQRAFMGVEEF